VKIFGGSSNLPLAEAICAYLGSELGKSTIKPFPDGETFVKIEENVRGEDVFVVQSTSPPTNHHLMEMFIMIDALRRASAARITAVLPFYGYARQDRKDQPRVPITAKLVANLLVTAGANRVLTMDLHSQQIQGFFDIPVDHLYAAPVFVRHLRTVLGSQAVVVAPDTGSVKMAQAYSDMLGLGFAVVAKRRISAEQVAASHLVGDVAGRDCVLVDDLTTTGATLIEAARTLLAGGASRVFAAITHYAVTRAGHDQLRDSCLAGILTTDSVPMPADWPAGKVQVLSVADLLATAVRRVHESQSVSNLFRA